MRNKSQTKRDEKSRQLKTRLVSLSAKMAVRMLTTDYIQKTLGHRLPRNKIPIQYPDFGTSKHQLGKLMLEVRIEDSMPLEGLLDTGAQASMISRDLLEKYVPKWRRLPDAGKIVMKSITQHKIEVEAAKWVKITFPGQPLDPILHKLAVTRDYGNFLLGEDFLHTVQPVLRYGPEGAINMEIGKATLPLRRKTNQISGTNLVKVLLQPLEEKVVVLRIQQDGLQDHVMWDDLLTTKDLGMVASIAPVFEDEDEGCQCAAVMLSNCGIEPLELQVGEITVKGVTTDTSTWEASSVTLGQLEAMEMAAKMAPNRQEDPDEIQDSFKPEDWKDLKEFYPDEDDVMNFNTPFGDAATHPAEVWERDSMDLLPFKEIEPKYHGMVKHLFCEKYKKLVAKHEYDSGNISKTLGWLYIPLAKPLPKAQKIYYGNATNSRLIRDILIAMERYGHIRKINTPYGAPIFLTKRKSGQARSRLLAAVCELNDCLADKPVSILPNIPRVIERLCENGVGLASSLDLKCAYYSLKIYPPHQRRAAFLTEFGAYCYASACMGMATVPHQFSSKISEAIHTDPETGKPDPIEYTIPFLDDIPIITPRLETEEETVDLHYQVLDKVLHRLHHHDFRINGEKVELFKQEAKVLGHVIRDGQISIDPKRLEKMRHAPEPTSRKGVQMWNGFLASIKYFAPLELAKCQAVLTPLTSAKREFKWEKEHHDAFEKAKKILTSHDFVLGVPNSTKPKLLYVDSSQLLAGAILLEVDLGEITSEEKDYAPEHMHLEEQTQWMKKQHLTPCGTKQTGRNSFFAVLTELLQEQGVNNMPCVPQELRMVVIATLDRAMGRHELQDHFCHRDEFHEFTEEYMHAKSGLDPEGLLLTYTAKFLGRTIMYMSGRKLVQYHGGAYAEKKPFLWIQQTWEGHTALWQSEPNDYKQQTSACRVLNDPREMTKKDILEQVKDMLKTSKRPQFPAKVISYFSKVVAEADRHRSIYELEAQALIVALHQLKPFISSAPAVITCVDSRTVYFLFSPGVYRSALKVRRWNVLLSTEYPNVVLHSIGSEENWSDVLSRLFQLPEPVVEQIDLKTLHIAPKPQLENKFLTCTDAMKLCEEESDRVSADVHSFEVLAASTRPIEILGQRMAKVNVLEAQKKELKNYENLTEEPNKWTWKKNDLVVYGEEGRRLYIPPSMEGLTLAYYHLVTGHSSVAKFKRLLREKYFFPQMESKARKFMQNCVTCATTNKLTGPKETTGVFRMPDYPFEYVFADLLEGLPANSMGYQHLLVITCPLTKNVYVYPLRNKKAAGMLEQLKLFLMHTNVVTRVLYTDNGSIFRQKGVLEFLAALGIALPKTTPYSSKSRGAVEVMNKLITILISKMTDVSSSQPFTEVSFLASTLLNNSVHPVIGTTPASLISGDLTMDKGPLGLENDNFSLSRLYTGELRELAEDARKKMQKRLDAAKESMKTKILNYHRKWDAGKMDRDFAIGDSVFVKNFTIPPSGVNWKFKKVLHSSPYVVIGMGEKTLLVQRMSDNLVSQVHKDSVKKYEPDLKIFDDLPPEVLKVMGAPRSAQDLEALRKKDKLDVPDVQLRRSIRVALRRDPGTADAIDRDEEEDKREDNDQLDEARAPEGSQMVRKVRFQDTSQNDQSDTDPEEEQSPSEN